MIIISLLILLFGAYGNACLSYFLDMCMMEGNIFHGYYRWMEKRFHGSFWYKPLGGCAICSNVWQGFGFFPLWVMASGLEIPPYQFCFFFLLHIVISNHLLRKMFTDA